MNILITIDLSAGKWINGLFQNTFFLAQMLKAIGYNVGLVVHHGKSSCKFGKEFPIFELDDLNNLKNIDILMQASWIAPNNIISNFLLNNTNCKNIHIHYGNKMIGDIEDCKSTKECITPFLTDEVWISPHFSFSKQYYECYYNCKVRIIPYIWSDFFIKQEEVKANNRDKTLFYDPEKEMSLCVLESNITFLKNCIPPIMIYDYVFNNYDISQFLSAFCAGHLCDKKYFKTWLQGLNSHANKKIAFYDRHDPSYIFGQNNFGVISHQILCGLNYSYLESLYLGVPILHNSKHFKDCGFFYKNYDINDAGEKLFNMINTYNDKFDTYTSENKDIIKKYSPENQEVINHYKQIINT